MSHAVETLGYCYNFVKWDSSASWHGLGKQITNEDELFDIEKFGERCGINWDVFKEPLITLSRAKAAVKFAQGDSETQISLEPDTDSYAVRRKTDGSILGVVGPQYRPLQNSEALKWFEPFLETKTLAFNTGGSLNNGRDVFVLAQVAEDNMMEVVKDDPICNFVLFRNSHSGLSAVKIGYTNIRVICLNTLRLAENSESSKLLRVRHSAKMKQNLEDIREIMNVARREFAATIEQYQWLASRDVNKNSLRKYVRILIQSEKIAEQPFDETSTRSQNIVLDVEKYMEHPNQKLASGSWWSAFNSMNGWLNYSAGRNPNNRLSSLWFGQNATLNKQAFELAMQMAA